jgi:hypothetical protein
MYLKSCKAIFTLALILLSASASSGYELKTRYSTIIYEKEDQLQEFNKEVALGSLSYLMKNKKSITANEEIGNKTDVIVERVETILEMFPRGLKFTIVLLSTDEEVQKIYRDKYGRRVDYIAFYSPRDKTVFISVNDIRLGVLAHEFAHVIIDRYYGIPTPVNIHEILAQYVESHLED